MISTIAILLGRFAQLPFLAGYRTQISAVGLIGLAVYLVSVGQFELGLSHFFFALGLLGLRFRFTPETRPVSPGDVDEQAKLTEELLLPTDDDTGPEIAYGIAEFGTSRKDRVDRRKQRREQAISGLRAAGVSNAAILGWLPVILALLQVMPDVAAVVKKILEAIRQGRTPAQFVMP